MERFDEAKDFAEKAHRGQMRKWCGQPYVVHPIRVMQMAQVLYENKIISEDAVIAAVLHDVIEDTKTTEQDIKKLFGDKVANYVRLMTNPSKGMTLPREDRKRIDREHLASCPFEVQVIKIIDRIDNLLDMRDGPASFVRLYTKESVALFDAILLSWIDREKQHED